jgi:hypothetical protein
MKYGKVMVSYRKNEKNLSDFRWHDLSQNKHLSGAIALRKFFAHTARLDACFVQKVPLAQG